MVKYMMVNGKIHKDMDLDCGLGCEAKAIQVIGNMIKLKDMVFKNNRMEVDTKDNFNNL